MSEQHPVLVRRFLPRSLTARLVTGVVLLVLFVVIGIGAGTYLWLKSFLYDRLDQQLSAAASISQIADVFNGHVEQDPGLRAPQRVYAVLLTADGRVLSAPNTPTVDSLNLRASDRTRLAERSSTAPLTVRTSDGTKLRVTARAVAISPNLGAGPTGQAVIGLSTYEVSKTLNQLLKLELLIGGVAVVLAFGITRYGVRFGLRHLVRVTQTAKEVATELETKGKGLDRRVNVHDPGTEVGELAESMNVLLATYETEYAARLASEERMRQFLADASHELRTPLTSIRGYAELARMQRAIGGEAASEETAENIARIESEGTRMSRLVDDLLTLARTDGSKAPPEREPVSVVEIAEIAVEGANAAFPGRPIEIDVPEELLAMGDQDQLLRVLRNLVTNAATYTRPGGPIAVRAHAERDGVVIEVLDSGPGLPPEEAAHVFERFWRANKARTSTSGGSGLGLSIVAAIVEAHGGTVRFDSLVETGSTVTVWLPAARL
jgi:two-component system OmpR family sensor kinase